MTSMLSGMASAVVSSGQMSIQAEGGSGGALGFLGSLFGGSGFKVPYNPSSFSLQRSTNWTELPVATASHGRLQFAGGGSDALTFTFLTDQVDSPMRRLMDPVDVINYLYSLTLPFCESGEGFKRPPAMTVMWGDFEFAGVIKELDVKYLMFSNAGRVLRAEVTVNLMGRGYSKCPNDLKELFKAPEVDKDARSDIAADIAVANIGLSSGLAAIAQLAPVWLMM